ncbi:MAG: hypothetical protein DHS20C16_06420 [Phycisphaerae bacterium]|nr:MAG: hypothetical protein DHS20C16_06420 [Phycisphaerae bacterium]
MDSERHQKLMSLFDQAVALKDGERAAFLDKACGGDAALRLELEALIANDADPLSFVDAAPSQAARAVAGTDVHLNTTIGSYSIIRKLGEGGMGVVYLAQQERPKRQVALKVIRPGVESRELLRRFEQESQVLGWLQHPGIAQVFEAGTADASGTRQPFFAMEYIEGHSLTEYANAHQLTARQRLDLIEKLCDAVHHAHQKGLIHRDLKPSNIIVNKSGQPKILDFGIARIVNADVHATETVTGKLVGTIAYMSPEQLGGRSRDLDIRSDVYSLGVICFELLTGQLPQDITDMTIPQAARTITEREPSRLSSINRSLRGDVETIVGKALQKEKDRRYQSASDFAADIRRYLSDQAISARPTSTFYQFRKFTRRNKALVGVVSVAFVALVAALIQVTVDRNRAIVAEQKARQNAELAIAAEQDALREAEQAEAVNEFLVDIFKAPNPEISGHDVRVADVLDSAKDKIAISFADQPAVRVALHVALGNTYFGLGLLEESDAEFVVAMETAREHLGEDHVDTLVAMGSLGHVRSTRKQYDDAERLLRGAYEGFERTLGEDSRRALVAANNYAGLLRRMGRDAEALPIYEKNLAVREQRFGADDPDTLASMNNLVAIYEALKRFDDAEGILNRLLPGCRKVFGDSDPRTLIVTHNYAVFLEGRGKPEEATPLYRKILDTSRSVFPEGHPQTLAAIAALAGNLWDVKRFDESTPLMREIVDRLWPDLVDFDPPSFNPAYGDLMYHYALFGLADACVEAGDAECAIGHLDQAVDSMKQLPEAEQWRLGRIEQFYGESLRRLKRFEEAETRLRKCYKVLLESLGDQDLRTQLAIQSLVRLFEDTGREEEAEEFQKKIDKNSGNNPP